jgi:purine-binding chemotaxis protein CheW
MASNNLTEIRDDKSHASTQMTVSDPLFEATEQFLTLWVNNQLFGVPVLKIRDVLKPLKVTNIPLSGPEIRGYMNLRGRIVTVIDVRVKLGLPKSEEDKEMFIVVEIDNELYSLVVDRVGDSKDLPLKEFEKNPVNLAQHWKDVSKGVFKRDNEIMLVLDINSILGLKK